MQKAIFAALTLVALATPALAAEPFGVWRRPEDGTTFAFFRCGSGLCVKVKGVTDPADRKYIGAMVFSGALERHPGRMEHAEPHAGQPTAPSRSPSTRTGAADATGRRDPCRDTAAMRS